MSSFETKRTFIRPLSKDDYQEILKMYLEKDSFKYIKPLRNLSPEEYTSFIDQKMKQNEVNIGFWCVYSKSNNSFLGTVNLNEFANTGLIQIGCHLSRSIWNQGYGLELMKAVVKYGVEERGLQEIHGVYEDNHKVSAKLLEQLGFEFKETMTFGDTVVNIMKLNA